MKHLTAGITAAFAVLLALTGCASPQPAGTAVRVDPSAAATDMGTLVDISDVQEVSQKMVNSLRSHPDVQKLLQSARPLRIAIEEREIKNLTSMTNFNKRLFIRQMLALLNRSAGEDFQFLDREAVERERARQLAGEVKTSGVEAAAAGAELVLEGRILEVFTRAAGEGGSVKETRSVQFSFSLVQVKDAVVLWADSLFRVKQQVIGTAYS